MPENEMTAEELVDYAIALLDSCDDAEVAEIEGTYECAVTIARAVQDGLITADGVTDLGVQHLADLFSDYENGE